METTKNLKIEESAAILSKPEELDRKGIEARIRVSGRIQNKGRVERMKRDVRAYMRKGRPLPMIGIRSYYA